MILCDCGEIIKNGSFKDYINKDGTFKAYIKTSANPSTCTIGHHKCGLIFDFFDHKSSKKYSSKNELKCLAVRFAEKNGLEQSDIGKFLLEVDRLKSSGKLADSDVLLTAYKKINDAKIIKIIKSI